MTKDETTIAIEKAGKKIEKGIIRSPEDKMGLQQEMTKEGQEEKIEETKKHEKKHLEEKPKKTMTVVNFYNVPVSTKQAIAICNFIKNKKIQDAIKDLEDVARLKKVIPMTGEVGHRKGRGIMSGRFPQKAAKNFIKLLKSLSANATYSGLENPVITEAIPNIGSRPYGKFGRVRRKRSHIKITARDKIKKEAKK